MHQSGATGATTYGEWPLGNLVQEEHRVRELDPGSAVHALRAPFSEGNAVHPHTGQAWVGENLLDKHPAGTAMHEGKVERRNAVGIDVVVGALRVGAHQGAGKVGKVDGGEKHLIYEHVHVMMAAVDRCAHPVGTGGVRLRRGRHHGPKP